MSRLRERIPGRDPAPGVERRYRPVQPAALLLGGLFVLIGVLGFVPGVTSNMGALRMIGPGSGSALLHYFAVSGTQNLMHLAFGVLFIIAAARARLAYWGLLTSGVVYLLLYVYGMFAGYGADTNALSLNMPSNWLHLGMAVVLFGVAFVAGRNKYPARSASPPTSVPSTEA